MAETGNGSLLGVVVFKPFHETETVGHLTYSILAGGFEQGDWHDLSAISSTVNYRLSAINYQL